MNLKQLNFSQFSIEEKVALKKRECKTPDDIDVTQKGCSNNKPYRRKFNKEWYKKVRWLCGSKELKGLFCFPCILFGGEETWTDTGFKNINKIKDRTNKHAKSKKHLDNMMSFSLLGTGQIRSFLSEEFGKSVAAHNAQVKKNRENFDILIEIVFKSCFTEQLLRGHDESSDWY